MNGLHRCEEVAGIIGRLPILFAEPYPDLWFLDIFAYGMFAAIIIGAFIMSVVIL